MTQRELTIAEEREAFERGLDDMLKEHADKAVLMKGGEVVGFFDELGDAYAAGVDRFGPHGTFLIATVKREPPQPSSLAWELGVMFG